MKTGENVKLLEVLPINMTGNLEEEISCIYNIYEQLLKTININMKILVKNIYQTKLTKNVIPLSEYEKEYEDYINSLLASKKLYIRKMYIVIWTKNNIETINDNIKYINKALLNCNNKVIVVNDKDEVLKILLCSVRK